MTARIWEIDFMRGIAILAMVVFHLVVDLNDFFNMPINYLSGFWYYEGKASASAFMLLAGISATLHRKNLQRGVYIFAWGMFLSAVTYFYNAETFIRYGILHLLGSCMFVFHFLQSMSGPLLFGAGSLCIAAGQWTATAAIATELLLPLGLTPAGFASIDYYPFLPWAGLFFYGTVLGKTLYRDKRSLFSPIQRLSFITRLGRHSLSIYLIHQPVLLALLWLYHFL